MTILKRVEGEFLQEGAGTRAERARALSEREVEPRENRTVGVSASRRALERGFYLVGWIRSRLLRRTVRYLECGGCYTAWVS